MWINQLINKVLKNNQGKAEGSGNSAPSTPSPEQILIKQMDLRLQKLEGSLDKAIAGYRLMLIKDNPDILPELIAGDTIEILDSSLHKARELTGKIKEKIEEKRTAERIPIGAPTRSLPDTDSLSPEEKIKYGLQVTNYK
jgi:hypothetical protein